MEVEKKTEWKNEGRDMGNQEMKNITGTWTWT
jgi:hypothetical protein